MPDQDELTQQCREVLAWVGTQNLPVGMSSELRLSSDLAHLSEGGVVQVAYQRTGCCCVLMKKSIGWKGNFEGVLYCEGDLDQSEVVSPATGASYISLPGFGIFEELYIRKRHSSQLFEVYFDLN